MTAAAKAERRTELQSFKKTTILTAARRVLARDGAEGMTMRRVADESGYAVGAVYGYFPSKAALLAELALEDLAAVARAMRGGPADVAARALEAGQALAAAPGLLSADGGAVPDETARALTGRLIALFQSVSAPLGLSALPAEEATARALALAGAAVGLAVLERSGQLQRLGVPAEAVLRSLTGRLSA
jgi:AcrR family transcriptional regulator